LVCKYFDKINTPRIALKLISLMRGGEEDAGRQALGHCANDKEQGADRGERSITAMVLRRYQQAYQRKQERDRLDEAHVVTPR